MARGGARREAPARSLTRGRRARGRPFADGEANLAPPRRGMVPERFPLVVKFLPKAAGRYRCTFNVKVKNGMTARFEVSAEATLREEDMDVVGADKHLRLMQLGELS